MAGRHRDDGNETETLNDRYKIIKAIGEGGFGTVFLATDLKKDNKK